MIEVVTIHHEPDGIRKNVTSVHSTIEKASQFLARWQHIVDRTGATTDALSDVVLQEQGLITGFAAMTEVGHIVLVGLREVAEVEA